MSDRSDITSTIVDAILKTLILSGTLTVTVMAPNALQALDKPLAKFFKKMDKRAQERELRRVLYYMKKKQLIRSQDYDHGISITALGRKRLQRVEIDSLTIAKPKKWDKKWRIVFFDIPESQKNGRDALTRKLKDLGFYQLQRSVLVHPYPCLNELTAVTHAYGINRFVSIIETDYIDKQKLLFRKFRNLQNH